MAAAATAATAAASALLAGCAGNKPVSVATPAGAPPLSIGYRIPPQRGPGYHVLLQPQGAAWQVLRFGTDKPARTQDSQEILFISRDGRWVQPAFDYAEQHTYFSCSALAKDPALTTYSPCGASRFATVNMGATAARTVLAVPLTMGMATGTNRTVDTAAVQAATESLGLLDQVRRARAAQQQADEALAAHAGAAADLARRARAELALDVRVSDASGFYTRGPEPLGRLVQVSAPDIAGPAKAELSRIPAQQADAEQFIAAYDAWTQKLKAATAALPDSYALRLQCAGVQSGPFAARLSCDSQARWADIQRGVRPVVQAEVLTLRPGVLSPSHAHADDTLQIRLEAQKLQLINRSAHYLEVREVSCYVEDEITSRRWGGNGSDVLTLPPQGQLKAPLRQDELCRDAAAARLQLGPVRLQDVKGRTLRFGMAVKFRRAGESTDRTLYQVRSLPLESLVRDPG